MEILAHNKPVLRLSPSNSSSDSSISSSVLLSMCPLSMDSETYLSAHDQPCLINSAKPKQIHKKMSKSSKQSDSLQVYSTDGDSIYSYSPRLARRDDKDGEESSIDQSERGSISQLKNKKNRSYQRLQKFFTQQSETNSLVSSQSCLNSLILRPQLNVEVEPEPSPITPTPESPPISPDRINHSKQRQIELDRTVDKLIETIKYETNKTIEQIFQYWSYIKRTSLEKYQPKNNPYQLFDYLFKCNYFNRNYDCFFEEHDELKAALQVLSTTVDIVEKKHSFLELADAFEQAEKIVREKLQYHLESLISSYMVELSFIRERIRFYQLDGNESKTVEWMQIIQTEYPCLIEKLSNDFLTEIPSIECHLMELIRETRKSLLNLHLLTDSKS